MSNKVDELLAVLDMPKDKQVDWLWTHGVIRLESGTNRPLSLADLAFWMRDETIANDDKSEIDCWWCEASYEVYLHIIGEENEKDAEGLDTWFSMRAQPIHFIIASLIAKLLAKEDDGADAVQKT